MPEKKKRGREKEASATESRPLPPVGSGGKLSSRAARQRVMAQREEQLAAQKVCIFRKDSYLILEGMIYQEPLIAFPSSV